MQNNNEAINQKMLQKGVKNVLLRYKEQFWVENYGEKCNLNETWTENNKKQRQNL